MTELDQKHKSELEKQHYEIVGRHSAVEVCGWTKQGVLDTGHCYKQKFYGIRSHRCVQMTPAASFCDQKCRHCWRANEHFQSMTMDSDIDEPELIIDGSINAQLKKLTGLKGNSNVSMQHYNEAQKPQHFAISLTGEPTLYTKLGELILELRKRGISSFLVTHGQHPEVLEKLARENALPTQLYISMEAPNRELHKKLDVPLIKNAWEKVLRTFYILPALKTRKVVRLTLIKDANTSDECLEQFAELMKIARPHFIEIKSYMALGFSRKRLGPKKMLAHKEILKFSKKLAKLLNWKLIDSKEDSRVALVAQQDYAWRIMNFDLPLEQIEATTPKPEISLSEIPEFEDFEEQEKVKIKQNINFIEAPIELRI